MSKSNTFERQFLSHILLNAAIPNIGDATGLPAAATAGNLYVAFHTADPGEAGTAVTSECSYTGYARTAVPRTSSGFTVDGTNGIASFAAQVTGGQRSDTGTVQVITHFSIVNTASGAGTILWSGTVTPNISVTQNVTPYLAAGQCITED